MWTRSRPRGSNGRLAAGIRALCEVSERQRVGGTVMGTSQLLQIHDVLPYSRANGPGVRAVIWMQGCTLACPGCFNPDTHPTTGGERVSVDSLFEWLIELGDGVEGITISGGEPLQQPAVLLAFLSRVRPETKLSILLFTGYTWEEVQELPGASEVLSSIDVLIAGRYEYVQRLACGLRGSANKTIHLLSDRYRLGDLQSTPPAEVIITERGEVIVSGIDVPRSWVYNSVSSICCFDSLGKGPVKARHSQWSNASGLNLKSVRSG